VNTVLHEEHGALGVVSNVELGTHCREFFMIPEKTTFSCDSCRFYDVRDYSRLQTILHIPHNRIDLILEDLLQAWQSCAGSNVSMIGGQHELGRDP
jgi:hypothetical protein